MNAIDNLVTLLAKLPGLGKKSAGRMAYHILEHDVSYARSLAGALTALHNSIMRCSLCGAWTETDPCPICADETRDSELLCVVERSQDVRVIEETREYHGRFHVLGGLISPLNGVNPGDLSIGRLLYRVKSGTVREVILAINPTVEGQTTALYLQKQLSDAGVTVSRLATGLPVGGDLEYTDRLTLASSFRGRVAF